MKNDDTLMEKFSLWLDDELSPVEVTELQAQLERDPASRQTFEAMQQADQLLRTAATHMAAPSPGFSQRFETRLAHHRPAKPWQIWLVTGALLGGTIVLFSGWAIVSGIALLGVSTAILDAGFIYQWLIAFIESANHLQGYLNFGALLLKASFITMQEPLFWICLFIAVSLIGLWVWVMRMLSRRTTTPPQLVI